MPLHRDIHWIGRQWAVTGHGVQLIDQKLQGFFDIEVSKLWNDALAEAMYAKDWLNTADFEKAIAVARQRYPQSTSAAPPIQPVAPRAPVARLEAPKPEKPAPVEPPRPAAELQASPIATPVSSEPSPSPQPKLFRMRYEGRARFVHPWRVVVRKI